MFSQDMHDSHMSLSFHNYFENAGRVLGCIASLRFDNASCNVVLSVLVLSSP